VLFSLRLVLKMRSLFSTSFVENGVATIMLNNPAKRNALSAQMVKTLSDNIAAVRGDKSVRMLILKSEGNVFSSGHDLKELANMTERESRELFQVYFFIIGFRDFDLVIFVSKRLKKTNMICMVVLNDVLHYFFACFCLKGCFRRLRK
jgi:1,4-dihydroxy-2-naphthoyl-CoA synthase